MHLVSDKQERNRVSLKEIAARNRVYLKNCRLGTRDMHTPSTRVRSKKPGFYGF
ncbi:hypothetical protein [Microseira wollei]|uniref:hypothetical protein n=1 Tax=Microseira wollei TaxID=467598 RepID=UPI001CFE8639|nr:hypothetical protein [Microseira wollei]